VTTVTGRRVVMQQQMLLGHAPAPPTTTTHHLRLLQVWQWEGSALMQAIQLCKQYGFTGLLVKALDGASWMSTFDHSEDAIGSVGEVQWQAEIAHMAGLYYFAWTNPLQTNLAVQADQTAQIANACDGVFLDVEPYNQFWGPDATAGLASSFMQAIREDAPDAFIALQPDPRPSALQSIRVDEWLPYCDAMSGQHYFSDFGSDPRAELALALLLGHAHHIPILPTLPGNAAGVWPTDLISGLPGFVVWRMGSTPPATLARLGTLAVAGLETGKIKALG
jgi:hypothetical protein